MPNNLLITGESGIGKSTVLNEAVEYLEPRSFAGFLSPRHAVRDSGWMIESFNGDEGLLVHESILSRDRLGSLGVDMALFERCVASEAASLDSVETVVIDEIGIIGGWSTALMKFVLDALDSRVPTIAIIRQKSGEFSDQIKLRPDILIWDVDTNNRDSIPKEIASWVERFDLHPH
jgi:nucleoside-triphosphatase THEP1